MRQYLAWAQQAKEKAQECTDLDNSLRLTNENKTSVQNTINEVLSGGGIGGSVGRGRIATAGGHGGWPWASIATGSAQAAELKRQKRGSIIAKRREEEEEEKHRALRGEENIIDEAHPKDVEEYENEKKKKDGSHVEATTDAGKSLSPHSKMATNEEIEKETDHDDKPLVSLGGQGRPIRHIRPSDIKKVESDVKGKMKKAAGIVRSALSRRLSDK